MVIAMKAIKPRKARPSEVCGEMISVCGEVWISLIMEFCQRVLNEKEKEMKEVVMHTEEYKVVGACYEYR